MKTTINFFKHSLLIAGCVSLLITAKAQENATLSIGDTAPKLEYAKWIKGTPVEEFKNDHLYVLEFWATWCGPCKAAMPHLTELAGKYKDKATFMGVNIWEKTGDKPYESSLPEVTRFVNSIGDKMGYNVLADNNAQYMANKWMIAAGQNGIPSTFLVKEGKVIWIGHPMSLDSIMKAVIADKYDMNSFKKAFETRKAKAAVSDKEFAALVPINKAYQNKEYDEALRLIDALNTTNQAVRNISGNLKFSVLLDQNKETQAVVFAKEYLKTTPGWGPVIAGKIFEKEGLLKSTYEYGLELYKTLLTGKEGASPMVQNALANAYAKTGDYKNAVSYQEQAVASAKQALKEGKYLGTILDYTITDYEEALKKFRKKL